MVTKEDLTRIIYFLNDDIEDIEKYLDKGDIEKVKEYLNYWQHTASKYVKLLADDRKRMRGHNITVTKKPATRKVKRA